MCSIKWSLETIIDINHIALLHHQAVNLGSWNAELKNNHSFIVFLDNGSVRNKLLQPEMKQEY